MENVCVNCGQRIIEVNKDSGDWVHQPAGSSFLDNIYRWCKLKVATPKQ